MQLKETVSTLKRDIANLVKDGVIKQETANKIQSYYEDKKSSSTNRQFLVFGILGSLLVGLGILLIIAHNWENFSKSVKVLFAFLPLIVGQILCCYTLIKKQDNNLWRESCASLLFFAVAASISIISQVYFMPGDLSLFLLTWTLLCLPLIYILNSSVISLFYILGITEYCLLEPDAYLQYLLLLLGALPHYFYLYKKKKESNFLLFHNWLIPISVFSVLNVIESEPRELIFVTFFSLFGLFLLIGNFNFFKHRKIASNSYRIIGSFGTIILLLSLSFNSIWDALRDHIFLFHETIFSHGFLTAVVISFVAIYFFYLQYKNRSFGDIKPLELVFILFIPIFIIGMYSAIAVVLINVLVFLMGILTIKDGAKQNHLGILNYGLLIITALIACRFFDTDLSFVFRGILFISVGAGFFVINYWILKKRKTNES